ncbi:MAG: dihydrolipoamide acetyltransferase family protein [Anaerolineaceae bacterium]|nr:dihydrolipoamide acetyltransferase family protein [Anaerolineaceae bacterium]
MASAVLLPKLGNSVESSLILAWHKAVGEPVAQGELLAEIETDKATLEIESPADGLLLARFHEVGDEVEVMAPVAVIGAAGEDIDDLRPQPTTAAAPPPPTSTTARTTAPIPSPTAAAASLVRGRPASSPRARKLAAARGIALSGLNGSGPGGRIIERDVQAAPGLRRPGRQAALAGQPRLTPVARAMLREGGYSLPGRGSGPRGRIGRRDLIPAPEPDDVQRVPLRGARRVIARRMLESLQTTAQLTLHAHADARALLALRQRLKAGEFSPALQAVTINDLLHYAVARTLPAHPALNAQLAQDHILRFRQVHLGFAVDTPRGLYVPVIRDADGLGLQQLADEARRLARACRDGAIRPEELEGATFTVSNLGSYGIESFTPVLNPPQAGILGAGAIHLKAVQQNAAVAFLPHIGLSLTIDHQVLDGAPAARFLQDLAQRLARIGEAITPAELSGANETP